MSIILSGMQPSGILHLGNYLGAIKTWKKMMKDRKNDMFYFMVVDLHSLTSLNNAAILSNNIKQTMMCYIASGIDFSSNTHIFQQSKISSHAELAWILQTITPIGWLNRMTQFKDKSINKKEENVNSGLLTYPALMAADILLYDADFVPVGEDQKQHIEFTRDIAEKFNREYNCNSFKKPEPIITDFARIMSLTDGKRKMSKSDPSDLSRILLTDTNDDIANKIKKAKTDSISEIYFDKENRPEISNLLNICACVLDKSIQDLEKTTSGMKTKDFKDFVTETVIAEISPISTLISGMNFDDFSSKFAESNSLMKDIAESKMTDIKRNIGIL